MASELGGDCGVIGGDSTDAGLQAAATVSVIPTSASLICDHVSPKGRARHDTFTGMTCDSINDLGSAAGGIGYSY